jgi:hypothetical protein
VSSEWGLEMVGVMVGVGVGLVLVVLVSAVAAVRWVVGRLVGVLVVLGVFAGFVGLGWVGGFGGWLGFPRPIVLAVGGLAVGGWLFAFVTVAVNALRSFWVQVRDEMLFGG